MEALSQQLPLSILHSWTLYPASWALARTHIGLPEEGGRSPALAASPLPHYPTSLTASQLQRPWPSLVPSKQAMASIPGPIGSHRPCFCVSVLPFVRVSVSLLLLVTRQWKAVGGGGLRLRPCPPQYLSLPPACMVPVFKSSTERRGLPRSGPGCVPAHVLCLSP